MLCHTSLFIFSLCHHVTFYKTLTSLSTVFIKGHVGFLQLLKWPCCTSFFTHVEPYNYCRTSVCPSIKPIFLETIKRMNAKSWGHLPVHHLRTMFSSAGLYQQSAWNRNFPLPAVSQIISESIPWIFFLNFSCYFPWVIRQAFFEV